MEISLLHLISPLYFVPGKGSGPFEFKGETEGPGSEEKLFCFELDETQYRLFEPDSVKLLGKTAAEGTEELPPGNYLFAQERKILSREEIIGLAVEIQQEGLWQRLTPGKKLYLRYLFEDGCFVTQLFRPYI